ncbi:MAG: leucine-rich repeat protein, partial [Lachnospiraceae bacterium]|nr:leucine-rich repeat protein [Lachnospiraceae bacterium]
MYIKKKYSRSISLVIIIAILINITALFYARNTDAEETAGTEDIENTEEEPGMVLYKEGKPEGEYSLLEDALNAMTDKNGDYKIVFNKNKEEYTLYGDIELPEVSTITLSGIYEMNYISESVADIYITKINTDGNIGLNSDLILEDIGICNINETKDCEFQLREHMLKVQGEHVDIQAKDGKKLFNLTGGENSNFIINNLDFYFNSNIIVGKVALNNDSLLSCNGYFNQIQELASYGGETVYNNRIFFNGTTGYNNYYNIVNIKIYKFLNIDISAYGRLDIGSIEQYLDIDGIYISSAYDSFNEDAYCHVNINGSINTKLYFSFYINNMNEKDFNIFCNTSSICTPGIPLPEIKIYLDCASHPEWKIEKVYKDVEGNIWFKPAEVADNGQLCYKLDEDSRDGQGIYYSLDIENKTATVGKDSNVLNSAGYKGAINASVIIPSLVEKDGEKYTVTRIGSNAFSNGQYIMKIEIADTVKSIGEKAFSGTSVNGIYIGSGVESIEKYALDAILLYRIYVNPANQDFFSQNNVLFDKTCETLIRFPGTNSLDMRNYSVPYPVKTIADGAFKNTYIENITLADSVKTIGEEAFSRCTVLESFSGNQIEEIKKLAFNGCYILKYLYPGTNLKVIETKAFNECNSLEWLFLPDNNMLIADKALFGMKKLKYFIGAKNAQYGTMVFAYCENLSFVSLSEYTENIPEGLFSVCSSLEKLYIPEQYTSCGLSAFMGIKDGQCTVYGSGIQKEFFIRALVNFEDKSGHEHIMATETIAEPGEKTCGAEVTYCTYCHYIEEGKLLPAKGGQVTIPTINTPVLKTPAPAVNETPLPETSITPVPEETQKPENTTEPQASQKPANGSNTGGSGSSSPGSGGSSGSGGGGVAAGGVQPVVTNTPVPSESPLPPVQASEAPHDTTVPSAPPEEVLQTPSPSPLPDTNINNIHKQMEIYSFSLNLDKNNHVKLKWNK